MIEQHKKLSYTIRKKWFAPPMFECTKPQPLYHSAEFILITYLDKYQVKIANLPIDLIVYSFVGLIVELFLNTSWIATSHLRVPNFSILFGNICTYNLPFAHFDPVFPFFFLPTITEVPTSIRIVELRWTFYKKK